MSFWIERALRHQNRLKADALCVLNLAIAGTLDKKNGDARKAMRAELKRLME